MRPACSCAGSPHPASPAARPPPPPVRNDIAEHSWKNATQMPAASWRRTSSASSASSSGSSSSSLDDSLSTGTAIFLTAFFRVDFLRASRCLSSSSAKSSKSSSPSDSDDSSRRPKGCVGDDALGASRKSRIEQCWATAPALRPVPRAAALACHLPVPSSSISARSLSDSSFDQGSAESVGACAASASSGSPAAESSAACRLASGATPLPCLP